MSNPNNFSSASAVVATVRVEDMRQIRTEFGGAQASGGAVATPVIPTETVEDEQSL